MVNLNKDNTIIENVEYLDMMDSKNSWYFDAERFDVNFPLVRSYNGESPLLLQGYVFGVVRVLGCSIFLL